MSGKAPSRTANDRRAAARGEGPEHLLQDGAWSRAFRRWCVASTLDRGAALGIVGESGSGKTVLSRSIMGLLPKRNTIKMGSVVFEGMELINMSLRQRQSIWGKEMSMIFQDPMTSLNPVMQRRQADRRRSAHAPRHVEGRRTGDRR